MTFHRQQETRYAFHEWWCSNSLHELNHQLNAVNILFNQCLSRTCSKLSQASSNYADSAEFWTYWQIDFNYVVLSQDDFDHEMSKCIIILSFSALNIRCCASFSVVISFSLYQTLTLMI